MKLFYFLLIGLLCCSSGFSFTSEEVIKKFDDHNFSSVKTVEELASAISAITPNQKEQLELLLLWADRYMQVDSARFFNGGYSLPVNESIRKKVGLCDEFSNIFSAFCLANNIKTIRIEGYVKEMNFKSSDTFAETNHAWNAVYVDSTWLLCDLFWSTFELKYKDNDAQFIKRLNPNYFLNDPEEFITTHLPVVPLFQFSGHPKSIADFCNNSFQENNVANNTVYNYVDSLNNFLKLEEGDQQLYIANRSYDFNHNNPNTLIATYYNKAAEIISNTKASKSDLRKAQNYLHIVSELIKTSTVPGILNLSEQVMKAAAYIDQVFKTKKG
jgi:hypothetical protein